MLILPDYAHAYMIDSVSSPIIPKHSWQFDGPAQDFMLKKILTLEETTGITLKISINNFIFNIPASWNILVVDDKNLYVDTMPITDAAKMGFDAYLLSPLSSQMETSKITILDYFTHETVAHTSIYKNCMMLHPVGPIKDEKLIYNCVIGPQDLHKFISDCSPKGLLF
jgi:hypothetical protein